MGLDIAPHGKDNHDTKGIMLTKTPGPPFPPTVTAGMLIDSANGKSISNLSFREALAVLKELGFPLTLRFHTDVSAHKDFAPYIEEAREIFAMIAAANGHSDPAALSAIELQKVTNCE